MTTHNAHMDAHEAGLADGCPRCAELAEQPLKNADERMIRDLLSRAVEHLPPRSEAEGIATNKVVAVLEGAAQIARSAPDEFETFLLERWHVAAKVRGGHNEH